MWGSEEAVELQAIQLMELEVLHYAPKVLETQPRLVLDLYTKELSKRFGGGALPLFLINPRPENMEIQLLDVCQAVREQLVSVCNASPWRPADFWGRKRAPKTRRPHSSRV